MNTVSNAARTAMRVCAGVTELVRGEDQPLIRRVTPMFREWSVTLDLCGVERIDAAGIAALISLYKSAHISNREFLVVNAGERVAEILNLVGLDHILLSHSVIQESQSDPCCASAAL